MTTEAQDPERPSEHEDERATEPPAEQAEERSGSQGNPEVDEEALSHRQQERGSSD